MLIISILSICLILSIILYSLCRIPSRTYRDVHGKSLVFAGKAEARHFEDVLSDGDAESIHRILKALQQRGEIDVTESEYEIYVSGHRSASPDHGRNTYRDLIAAAFNPLEDLRNLSARSRFHPGSQIANADKGMPVIGRQPVPIDHFESATDHLFASEYDVSELLGNIGVRPGPILACDTAS